MLGNPGNGGSGVLQFLWRLSVGLAAAGRERHSKRIGILDRIADPDDAKAAEAVEDAVAGVGRQRGEIDRNPKRGSLDGPPDGLARPGIAAAQEVLQLVLRIEAEPC